MLKVEYTYFENAYSENVRTKKDTNYSLFSTMDYEIILQTGKYIALCHGTSFILLQSFSL